VCRDIVAFSGLLWRVWWSAEGLVVAVGVEGELAEELAGFGVDDAGVEIGDEKVDARAGVGAAEADVAESAVVAQGDDAGGVDAVAADAVVAVEAGSGRVGLGSGRVGLRGGGTVERAVGSDGVVVAAEPVDWSNHPRLHGTLGMLTPAEYEQAHYAASKPQQQPQRTAASNP
jgi:hypothetical protein